jgi:hypothetical protein
MNNSTKSPWRTFLRFWSAIRQILSIRSLLQWLGLWHYIPTVVSVLVSLGFGAWAYLRGLSGPNIALIVIASFGLITVIGSAILHACRPQSEPSQALKARTQQLANDLFAFLQKQGPRPPSPLSSKGTQEEQRRAFDAYFEWTKSTYFKYMAHFKDRVVTIDFELAAENIFTKLEPREIDPPQTSQEVDVKKIAEALLLTASQMSDGIMEDK